MPLLLLCLARTMTGRASYGVFVLNIEVAECSCRPGEKAPGREEPPVY